MVKIKNDYDFHGLTEFGYTFSIIEGGFVSQDKATIVFINRSPYQKEVHPYYLDDTDPKHKKNVALLKEKGILEESL